MYKFGRIPGAHACDHGLGVQAKVCVAFCVKYSSDVEPYTIYKLGTYRKGSRDGAWQAYRRQIILAGEYFRNIFVLSLSRGLFRYEIFRTLSEIESV